MFDYHVHTHFSADSEEQLAAYIRAASQQGIQEICFTDHYDRKFVGIPITTAKNWEADMGAACAAIAHAQEDSPIRLRQGVEMGLRLEEGIQAETDAYLAQFPLDFIIASVHLVDGQDPWFPQYFEGRSKQQGFVDYLQTIYDCLQQTENWQAVGHIDYPAKGCPYDDKTLRYRDAPDLIDALFQHVIARGKCIEINGSVLRKLGEKGPDMDIYRRYAELGGQYITLGSDAHQASALGQELRRAAALAKEAGIGYVASFVAQQPTLHAIDAFL